MSYRRQHEEVRLNQITIKAAGTVGAMTGRLSTSSVFTLSYFHLSSPPCVALPDLEEKKERKKNRMSR